MILVELYGDQIPSGVIWSNKAKNKCYELIAWTLGSMRKIYKRSETRYTGENPACAWANLVPAWQYGHLREPGLHTCIRIGIGISRHMQMFKGAVFEKLLMNSTETNLIISLKEMIDMGYELSASWNTLMLCRNYNKHQIS